MTDARVNYAAQPIIETLGSTAKPVLTPIACKKFNDGAADAKLVKASDGSVVYGTVANGVITWASYTAVAGDKVVYLSKEFQMETTPADKIPSIKPVLKRIALTAEPRRIAVKYDQITAYQAKTDYGFSLDKQIAEQACGELAYKLIVA